MKAADCIKRYEIRCGNTFRLKQICPDDTGDVKSKEHAQEALETGIRKMIQLQEKLYAADRLALLLIFQAMDAAGKDSAIKHVMSGVNPQGCQVFSFKAPSPQELDHDFLWRTTRCLPERGRIGIFNRSYYEEVLVVRVHPEWLQRQKLPPALLPVDIWKQRYADINAHERYLSRNGIVIRKFFLHVSREEQRQRFLSRIEEPEKNWKFSLNDVHEREYWNDYMRAYEDMIRNTSTPHSPWYVVPADHKWFTRLVVANVIVHTLKSLNLAFPAVGPKKQKELRAAHRALLAQGQSPG